MKVNFKKPENGQKTDRQINGRFKLNMLMYGGKNQLYNGDIFNIQKRNFSIYGFIINYYKSHLIYLI